MKLDSSWHRSEPAAALDDALPGKPVSASPTHPGDHHAWFRAVDHASSCGDLFKCRIIVGIGSDRLAIHRDYFPFTVLGLPQADGGLALQHKWPPDPSPDRTNEQLLGQPTADH
jgi:hypothetical protein